MWKMIWFLIIMICFTSCEGVLWDGGDSRNVEETVTLTVVIDFPEWEHFYP